jgi:endo-1,4-beta-xylanase
MLGAGAFAARAADASIALKEAAKAAGLAYGAAVEPAVLDRDARFAALARQQCAVLVPENAMKWDALRPSPDAFDFARGDRLVAQARAMGAQVHGHCLVWHEALPPWFPKGLDRAAALDLLEGHIWAVADRYAGAVAGWDVVNEAVERADGRPDGLRRSPWLNAIGPDYIALSFRAAHAAAPAARLTLSDYGLEYDDVPWMVDKRSSMLALLKALKAAGVPVHALGLQSHLLGDRAPAFGAGLRDFLRQVAGLGLEIYVTELDVNDQAMPGSIQERDRTCAAIYHAYLDAVLAEPAVRMVNTWGLSDRYTSKSTLSPRPDGAPVRPLPFDDALNPKPAALAMVQAFRLRARPGR